MEMPVQKPILLNLGCGGRAIDGWIGIDKAGNWSGNAPDVDADLRSLPFPDNYADEAIAIHVIEHFWVWDVPDLLKEWVRVIKPGCKLVIECPCLPKVLRLFDVPNVTPDYTFGALYGSPTLRDPDMMHKWCYGQLQLGAMMKTAGLVDVHEEEPQFHKPLRDMRMVGTKPK